MSKPSPQPLKGEGVFCKAIECRSTKHQAQSTKHKARRHDIISADLSGYPSTLEFRSVTCDLAVCHCE